jgi:GTP-binding protein EngB required for normal cell division
MTTNTDVNRRKEIENYLLSSEKILENDCRTLEKEYLTRLTKEQLKELMMHISYINSDAENSEESHPSDDDTEVVWCESFISNDKKQDDQSSKTPDFLSIKVAMNNWRDSISARRSYQSQTSQMSNSSNSSVLSTTKSVIQVIPRLFTMNIALTKDFALKFDIKNISWKQIGVATVGGCIIGFFSGFLFLSTLIACLLLSASDGLIFGGMRAIFECLKSVHLEYIKILVFIAKSLGVIMDQVRMHQYCLEEKISSIYRAQLDELRNEEHFFAQWKNIFPNGVLNKLQSLDQQRHCLSIMKCIDANFQMRKLLSKDFALGVIGPGKSGKSTILQNMFGFNTNPDKEIRTEDLHCYRVNEDFRVIDFPHMTSVFDDVKNCFTCNHNLVNVIIVVLNAEQGGNDIQGEGYVVNEVKKLVKKGVNVLFCFNQCDKLAVKNRSKDVRRNIDQFSLYETNEIQQSNENDQYEYWTEEHAEEKRRQWAKNYKIDLDKCWMTFCGLEEKDDVKRREDYKRLKSIKLQTHLDIKNGWLKQVLEENSLSTESINEIMNFKYEEN